MEISGTAKRSSWSMMVCPRDSRSLRLFPVGSSAIPVNHPITWRSNFCSTSPRETEEPGRTQDRSKDRCPRQVNCLPNLAWTKAVWRCRLRVCVPIGLQMPVFMTCENFCQAIKAGAVGCRPVCWAVLNGSSPLCLPWVVWEAVSTRCDSLHVLTSRSKLVTTINSNTLDSST